MTDNESFDTDNLRKARTGNHQAFRALVEPHERELQRHCYRMTGSYDDADDLVQETLFRPWRALGTYVSHGSFRAWLYRIATNRTLDLLGSAPRRREVVNTAGEPVWLQPYPPPEDTTGDAVADLDAVGLAFVLALQRLNARQRSANVEIGFATYIRDRTAGSNARHCIMLVGGAPAAAVKITGTMTGDSPRR